MTTFFLFLFIWTLGALIVGTVLGLAIRLADETEQPEAARSQRTDVLL